MARRARRGRSGGAGAAAGEPLTLNPAEILRDWWNATVIAAGVAMARPLALAGAQPPAPAKGEIAQAARGFPVVGLAQGLIAALAYAIADGLNLPPFLSAVIAISALVFLGGAVPEGSLGRFAEAVFAGGTPAAQRKALAEGPLGAYGISMVVIVLALRIGALAWLAAASAVAAALAAAVAAATVALPLLLYALPAATRGGFIAAAGVPRRDQVVLSAALGAALALLFLGPLTGVVALAVGALAGAKIAWLAKRRLGGATREVLAAAQQATEIGMLLAIVAMA